MAKQLHIQTSTIADGNMDFRFGAKEEVRENRKKFLEKYGLTWQDCVVMELEHQDKIVRVDADNKPKDEDEVITAEALITHELQVVLFMKTADCLPVVLYDARRQALALAHLGRKPTGIGLLPKVLERMKEEFGSEPKDIEAYMGPGIQKESYRLPGDVEDLQEERWQPFLEILPTGEVAVDVAGYNTAQLEEQGVKPENIHINQADTAVSAEYFSHYRALRNGDPEGRFVTAAWLSRNPATPDSLKG